MVKKVRTPESFFKFADTYDTGKQIIEIRDDGNCSDPKIEMTFWGWLIRICIVGMIAVMYFLILLFL